MKNESIYFKIFLLLAFNTLVFFIHNPIQLAFIFLIFLVINISNLQPTKDRLKTILPICIMIILFQLVFNQSIPITERLIFGTIATLRIVLISLSTLLFLASVSINKLYTAFSFLPKSWRLLLLMTSHLIPNIISDTKNIQLVQQARGFSSNKFISSKNIAAIIIPLLHRIFKRAEVIALSISSRGYEE